MNKSIYSVFSIIEWTRILMSEFCYEYVKRKYGQKTKLGYMDTDSFIVYVKKDDIYKDIAKNVGTRSATSNYELNSSFPKEKS